MRQLKISNRITPRTGSLDITFDEMKRYPMITTDEEERLSQLIREGDMNARNQLVESNLRFVVSVAKQYQNRGVELSDLINEGNIGLLRAAEKFDFTKGFKFISYAVWWIRQSIENAICTNGNMIRIPLNRIGLSRKIQRLANEYELKNGRKPSVEELASQVKCSEENVAESLSIPGVSYSLDQPFGEEGDGCLYDVKEDVNALSPDTNINTEACRKEIYRILGILDEREQEIIKMSFGLGSYNEMSLDEIGAKLNLTRERVRQLKEKSIRKIQRHPAASLLKAYL